MRLAPSLYVLPAALLLAGCFAGEEKPRLEGERLNVTMQPATLAANPAAGRVPFILPEPARLENWAQAGAESSHAPGHIALPASVKRAWSASIGTGNSRGNTLLTPPVVHSGRVFAVDTRGTVSAFNANTGERIWRISLPVKKRKEAQVAGGIAVSGNLAFITSGTGEVFALSADKGELVWQTPLDVPLRAAPTVFGESVFVLSHDNRIFALSALNGGLLWTHSGMEETLAPLKAASPAVANGAIAVPYTSGEIYVLRASDGRYIWHDTLVSSFNLQDPEMTLSAIAAPPVIADGVLYVVGMNGGLSAYGLVNGQRFWRTELATSQLPIVAGAQIYMLTDKGELAALNRQDGLTRWVSDLNALLPEKNDKRLWVGPVLAGGRLIVASNDGYAVSLNPASGKMVAQTELDAGVSLSPVVANGGLFFLTETGKLIAFRGE
jgi:outer membrane protein assembly factor BamB